MPGDGINDAPALAAADITLVHGGVGAAADAVMLARATLRIIRQNLGWAFGYNLLLVPLAAAGILPPVLAPPMSRRECFASQLRPGGKLALADW